MTAVEVFPDERGDEPHPYLYWLLTLILIALSLWASHWQYERGVARHHRNFVILQHVDLPQVELSKVKSDPPGAEWRTIHTSGHFDTNQQILLRNKYLDGKYGLELLTLFHDDANSSFWVDRGWIAPGATATAPPLLPLTAQRRVEITGRLRLDRSLPQGSYFAIGTSGGNLIEKWNAQTHSAGGEAFYIDLLSSSDSALIPAAPVALPELTDGPHMAYALQWLFFAGLALYGRILLRRSR